MSKANWAKVQPSSGSGNATVNVSSDAPNTGRNKRSTTLTITAANVTPVSVAVNQAGKPQYVDAQDTATAAKAGANVTISGKSNAKKLTFSIGTSGNTLKPTLPAKYTAAGVETANGGQLQETLEQTQSMIGASSFLCLSMRPSQRRPLRLSSQTMQVTQILVYSLRQQETLLCLSASKALI